MEEVKGSRGCGRTFKRMEYDFSRVDSGRADEASPLGMRKVVCGEEDICESCAAADRAIGGGFGY